MHGAKLAQPGITSQGTRMVGPAHRLLPSKQGDKAFVNRPSETIAGMEREDSRHGIQGGWWLPSSGLGWDRSCSARTQPAATEKGEGPWLGFFFQKGWHPNIEALGQCTGLMWSTCAPLKASEPITKAEALLPEPGKQEPAPNSSNHF